jgi:hypothetical protein
MGRLLGWIEATIGGGVDGHDFPLFISQYG